MPMVLGWVLAGRQRYTSAKNISTEDNECGDFENKDGKTDGISRETLELASLTLWNND